MEMEMESFERDGYFVCKDSKISKQLLKSALSSILHILKDEGREDIPLWLESGERNHKNLRRITQIHLANDCLYKLITDRKIGEIAARIMGAKQVRVMGSQLYYKPSGGHQEGQVGLHRDSQHLPCFAKGVLTAWLPLTAVNAKSGSIRYIDGSHKWPENSQYSGAQIQNFHQQCRLLQKDIKHRKWREKVIELEPGGLSFHHRNTLHGSDSNKSNSDRCAIAIALITDDLKIDHNHDDYGYIEILNNLKYCPIIYQQ